MTEGTVTRWLKQVGDPVAVDEPLLEVSTDKVDTEIPSPVAGTLLEITAGEDETVEVGGQLAMIGSAAGASATTEPTPAAPPAAPASTQNAQPAPARERQQASAASSMQSVAPPAASPAPATAPGAPSTADKPVGRSVASNGGGPAYLTPLVRKLASEHGVDVANVRGTGVGGRIRKQDILDAAARLKTAAGTAPVVRRAPVPSPLRGTTEKLTRLRTVIARRMVESLQVSAQLTSVVEVDVTRIAQLREKTKADFLARHGVKLSYFPFFAMAAVEALREHPKLNSTVDLDAGTLTYHDAEDLGIAVDTERGLIVPVVRGAGDLNLGGMARKIAELAERTRDNKLSPDELSGGTFTLTNTGSRGALFDTPIINQPQSAILGTGAVVKRAVVIEDPNLGEVIVPRSMVYLSLTYDHRIVDGADAARYLVSVKERLESGAFEADLGLSS